MLKALKIKGFRVSLLGSNPPLPTKRNLNRTTLWRLGFSFFIQKRRADLYNTSARRSAILNIFVNMLD